MQDFWKVALSFEIPWETDLGNDGMEDSALEVEEFDDLDEEEAGLDYQFHDTDQRMEIWGFEL